MQINTQEGIVTIIPDTGYILSNHPVLGTRLHAQGFTFRLDQNEYDKLAALKKTQDQIYLGKQPLTEFIEKCEVSPDSDFAKDLEKVATKQPLDPVLASQRSLVDLVKQPLTEIKDVPKKGRKSNKK